MYKSTTGSTETKLPENAQRGHIPPLDVSRVRELPVASQTDSASFAGDLRSRKSSEDPELTRIESEHQAEKQRELVARKLFSEAPKGKVPTGRPTDTERRQHDEVVAMALKLVRENDRAGWQAQRALAPKFPEEKKVTEPLLEKHLPVSRGCCCSIS